MIPDGSYTAVVDRIEDAEAVLEVDGGDERYELVVDPETLPEDGRQQDAVLHVELVDESIVECAFDASATESRKSSAQDRFDRLSSRPNDDNASTAVSTEQSTLDNPWRLTAMLVVVWILVWVSIEVIIFDDAVPGAVITGATIGLAFALLYIVVRRWIQS